MLKYFYYAQYDNCDRFNSIYRGYLLKALSDYKVYLTATATS
jgi:hypothetical protein